MILIGNYPPDKQESMIRFANMLKQGFENAGVDTSIWKPVVVLGKFSKSTVSGIGKWLGYIDKWMIFPLVLRGRKLTGKAGAKDTRYHICDHSNSAYLNSLPKGRTVITCHDVLAIRGALGYEDAFCSATFTGKILQKWILRNLSSAEKIACVSALTLKQLKEIAPSNKSKPGNWSVIHNGFNSDFKPVEPAKAALILKRIGLEAPYILHVGSSLPRKNRKLLLEMVSVLGNRYSGQICFAGDDVEDELRDQAEKLHLTSRVVSIVKPNHETLTALYTACDAFIFPSFSEGFGWPVIEAQACGAPVIASNIEPMPEVSGGAALHADPTKPYEFSDAFISLQNGDRRAAIVKAGFQNSLKFKPSEMIKSYLSLHSLPAIIPADVS